jgi:hypothetical protein
MDKVQKILDLISEKSGARQEEYSDLINGDHDHVETAEILGAIPALDEMYNEVKLIQKQDD